MVRTFVFAILVTLLVSCGTHTRSATEYKGRIIVLTDAILSTGGTDTVRFGRLGSGEIAVMHFRFANATQRPVVITSYDRVCGCTTLDIDNQPIAPDATRDASLTFDSRGEWGWQLKTIDIRFAGTPKTLRLFIEADVE